MEKWRHSKYVARPVSVRITHRFASPPRAGNQNTSLKHWPERNALRRQHWSWLGPDEPIRLLALDRPAGTLPRVREDKVGDPCPTAPACLHFPWQCMTVCVFQGGYFRALASLGLWTLRHSVLTVSSKTQRITENSCVIYRVRQGAPVFVNVLSKVWDQFAFLSGVRDFVWVRSQESRCRVDEDVRVFAEEHHVISISLH